MATGQEQHPEQGRRNARSWLEQEHDGPGRTGNPPEAKSEPAPIEPRRRRLAATVIAGGR